MTGGTGGCTIICPGLPTAWRGIPVILVLECPVDVSMLGLHVDFNLRMIGSQVTGAVGEAEKGKATTRPMAMKMTGLIVFLIIPSCRQA